MRCTHRKENLVARTLIPVTALTLLLTGCAGANLPAASSGSPSARSAEACDADKAESAVGQRANSGLIEQYRELAGAKTARALRPRDVMTMEYDPTRLNLKLDDNDVVISVNCS
ncbi:proteinase inhibitor I78 [Parapusillimonas sp. SGNA-6]|nr:proteinase inhibitor I78 [Parapusillimonas sp. SGNA-6]